MTHGKQCKPRGERNWTAEVRMKGCLCEGRQPMVDGGGAQAKQQESSLAHKRVNGDPTRGDDTVNAPHWDATIPVSACC